MSHVACNLVNCNLPQDTAEPLLSQILCTSLTCGSYSTLKFALNFELYSTVNIIQPIFNERGLHDLRRLRHLIQSTSLCSSDGRLWTSCPRTRFSTAEDTWLCKLEICTTEDACQSNCQKSTHTVEGYLSASRKYISTSHQLARLGTRSRHCRT